MNFWKFELQVCKCVSCKKVCSQPLDLWIVDSRIVFDPSTSTIANYIYAKLHRNRYPLSDKLLRWPNSYSILVVILSLIILISRQGETFVKNRIPPSRLVRSRPVREERKEKGKRDWIRNSVTKGVKPKTRRIWRKNGGEPIDRNKIERAVAVSLPSKMLHDASIIPERNWAVVKLPVGNYPPWFTD